MKVKYTGNAPEITFRGVTFEKGKPVDLTGDSDLLAKVLALDYFAVVRPRARKNDKDKA